MPLAQSRFSEADLGHASAAAAATEAVRGARSRRYISENLAVPL